MNGDILTSLDYSAMLQQHTGNKALATMAVKQHSHEIPYGVVETDGNRIKGFREKPRHTWNVNAGIYILNPRIREFMPEETFFNLPTLFENVISHNGAAEVFAISENWMDIGRPDDVSRAENVLKQDKTKFQLYSSDAKRR